MNIIENLKPLMYAIIIVIIIISLGKSLIRGEFKAMPIQLFVCCIIAYMVYKPDSFRNLGELIIAFINSLGVNING